MNVLVLCFLVISSLLLLVLVVISLSFLGLYLSELGLWFSWMPFGLGIASIPFLIQFSAEPQPSVNFFLLLVSVIFNIGTFVRLIIPFLMIYRTNREFKTKMKQSFGADFLLYIAPTVRSRFFKNVRFRLKHYFCGIREKSLHKNIEIQEDIIYRTVGDEEIKLDVYYPRKDGTYPIIVFIHGGGWMRGSKDVGTNEKVAKLLATYGYTVFNIDYRLSPSEPLTHNIKKPHEHPTILEMVSDVKSAISFTLKNGKQYKGDTENIFLFGRSAGAHLALLTAFSFDENFFEEDQDNFSLDNSPITGVIAFYPITDMGDLDEFYDELNPLRLALVRGTGGTPEERCNLYELFSPINYVTENTASKLPPVFLAAGKYDRIVEVYQSEELSDELSKLSIPNVFLELPWANHAFDLLLSGPGGQLVIKYMTQFLVWCISKKNMQEIEAMANEAGLKNIFSIAKMKSLQQSKKRKSDER
ncbi:MAG: alpha/beta hydrolase fold domain-containing protein [Candidatus Heimdallarchaeota archaeon]